MRFSAFLENAYVSLVSQHVCILIISLAHSE